MRDGFWWAIFIIVYQSSVSDSNQIVLLCHYHHSCGVDSAILLTLEMFTL